jgi:uncharacterized protein YdhG (YjbR/CyaY superfamily)
MKINVRTPEEYIAQIPPDRRKSFEMLRKTILDNLPEGFTETISYGMIGYVVPFSIYPGGYQSDPKQPLPFVNLASQKNYFALHHLGLYASKDLLDWFAGEYPKFSKTKPDMGKGCVRFKDPDKIPYELIGKLICKISVPEWIALYESNIRKKPRK